MSDPAHKSESALASAPIGQLMLKLAVPSVAAQFINLLYNIVDRIYIGHIPDIGRTALTGLGVTFPIITLISAFAAFAGQGGAPLASIRLGAGDREGAEEILGNSVTLLLAFSAVLTAVFLVIQRPVLMAFGASENTIGYAMDYIQIYAIGTIFVQLTLGLNAFISCQGFSLISMFTVCIGAVTNIVLDPIFIFVFGMGVQGAALATVLSQAFSAAWAIYFLCSSKSVLRLQKKNLRLSASIMLPCIALGVAPFLMQATESVLVLCFNSSLLRYGGDLAVGAMTILSSVMQFAMLPLQGITQGGQPIISYNYGAKLSDRVKRAFRLQTLACLGYSTILWAMVLLFPGLFVAIFTNDPELTEITCWALRIYMSTVLLMGIQISCQQSFIAFGNSKISAFLAVLRKMLLLIPLIYILPMLIPDKVFAVFLAEPIADTIAVATTAILFYREFKKMMREMQQKEGA